MREGDLDASGDRLVVTTIAPLLDEIGRLRADREARIELATRALTGSLAGLGESLDRIADDADHETIDVEALRRLADRSYEELSSRCGRRSARARSCARRRCGTGNRSSVPTR